MKRGFDEMPVFRHPRASPTAGADRRLAHTWAMRTWAFVALLFATPAFADDKPKPAVEESKPAAKPATCKPQIVGRGLDRKVVCKFEQEIVLTAKPPKPAVVIAPVDGRRVTGRPKLTDPLTGLKRSRSE